MKYIENSQHKLFKHLGIYFIEIIFATSLIVWLIEGTIINKRDFSEILRQYVFAYTLYQIILVAAFKFKDSTEIDALTSIKDIVDKFQLYAEFDMKIPEFEIKKIQLALVNNPKVSMKNNHRELVRDIVTNTVSYNESELNKDTFRFSMKQTSREIDTLLKIYSFHWMNSVLLRFSK
ncbi:hypothetical protein [Paenibacillus polymyxa]|uniref:hypothetical protein n=1 Tax=Paenibacillus polymyxa TaxID=1406 RepID=UPI00237A0831|nr:hypothetical protein [Paenibacillus polymyxa]WDM23498.1 hypothetical protein J4I02_08310 [Paenibacillus polymyxa]